MELQQQVEMMDSEDQKKKPLNLISKSHKHKLKSKFKPNKIPGHFELAQRHKDAQIVGNETETNDKSEFENTDNYCHCCGRYAKRDLLDLTCSPMELDFIGSGYTFYFYFIQFCMLIILSIIVLIGIYNFFSNGVIGDNCIPESKQLEDALLKPTYNHCTLNWITRFTIVNKRKLGKMNELQEILNIFPILAMIIIFQIIRHRQRIIDDICNKGDLSVDDYAIFVKKIPKNIKKIMGTETIEQGIIKFFSEKYNCEIPQVSCCFDLDEISQKQQQKQNIIKQLQKLRQENNKKQIYDDTEEVDQFEDQLKQIEQDCRNLEIQYNKEEELNDQNKFLGMAFVCFPTQDLQNQVLKKNSITRCCGGSLSECNIGTQFLEMHKAVYPTDVFWENLNVSKPNYICRRIGSYIITIITMLICFAIILALSIAQLNNQNLLQKPELLSNQTNSSQSQVHMAFLKKELPYHNKDPSTELNRILASTTTETQTPPVTNKPQFIKITDYDKLRIYGILISIVIFVMNQIMNIILISTCNFECYQTKTEYNISFAYKMAFASFFNSAIVSFIIKVVYPAFINYQNGEENIWRESRQNVYESGGLVYNQYWILFTNSIISPLIYLIDPYRIFKQVMLYFEKKKAPQNNLINGKNVNLTTLTQLQLNQLYEEPEFNIGLRYSWIINTMYMTAFYAPLIPIALLFSLCGFFSTYWIEKYKVLRHRTIPYNISSKISISMISLLEGFLFLYSFSEFMFQLLIIEDKSFQMYSINFICIIVVLFHNFMPTDILNKKIFGMKQMELDQRDWSTIKHLFDIDYKRANPVTKYQNDITQSPEKDNQQCSDNLIAENQ